jgi:hypothetical protein
MRPTCAFAAQIGWKSPCLWKLAHFRDLVDAATDVVGSVGDMRTDPAPAISERPGFSGSLEQQSDLGCPAERGKPQPMLAGLRDDGGEKLQNLGRSGQRSAGIAASLGRALSSKLERLSVRE